ncbi:hypothetical protein CI109_102260 [Kwoniella shandongensis]|uniref:Uncharacterized protein n=1 Tax=Kwoniella shandongensis TaxID=1734106 RepID=A0A5M6BZ02_9TREE|nr:uncharacterized protein CI109_003586 [Kwoniella shandongensis]KAA5527933.1 hypothetical protein CI109_003586 [Kwoniella shandongensis]
MVSPTPTRIPPIKLKLSLSSKPSAQAPQPLLPSTPLPAASKKGKAKAVDESQRNGDEVNAIPATGPETNGKKKSGKHSKAPAQLPSTPTPVHPVDADISSAAGPSSLRIVPPQLSESTPLPAVESPSEKAFGSSSQHTPLPSTPTPASTSRPKGSTAKKSAKSTPRTTKAKQPTKSALKARSRPTAIPSRLLSATSTPSRPSPSLPLPETPAPYDPAVKVESSEATSPDPLSLPLSPSAIYAETPDTPQQDEGVIDTPTGSGRGRTGGRWMRIKKPLKELLNKIMTEIRRKDDYALFEEPVDLDAFPDYLSVIGGEDKMMDMGTMQSKIDTGEYRNIDQIEADLRALVAAAQKFNPPGTIPYNSAGRILTVGMKHIDRSRPLVLTPSPSPTRASATPFRGGSVYSGREMTAALDESGRAIESVTPTQYIPEQMLTYPPNSLEALAVGWNLTGGRRIHAKRVVRSREKFGGKWRHWDLDGSRDVAEMEDIESLVEPWRMRKGEEWRTIVDWKSLRKAGPWWESDTTNIVESRSTTNQPPVPFAPHNPRRDKVSERELGPLEWGVFPEIDAEVTFLRSRTGVADDQEILSEHLRPAHPRPPRGAPVPPQNLVNIYDEPMRRTPGDWVREMCTGDVRGEAYLASVEKFVNGAMASGSASSDDVEGKTGDRLPLDEYVFTKYHDGLLSSGPRKIVASTLRSLNSPHRPSYLDKIARHAYARIALKQMTAPSNPMDIKPLLREESDFLFQGVGGKTGVKEGLEWTGAEIARLDAEQRKARETKRKRDSEEHADVKESKKVKVEGVPNGGLSGGSSPLTAPPGSPNKMEIDEPKPAPSAVINAKADAETQREGGNGENMEALKRLRLELVALSKFYPLPALKKMSKEEAAQLLPFNVRGLMSRP